MGKLDDWMRRMTVLISQGDSHYNNVRTFVNKHCIFKGRWFCNGKPNKTVNHPEKNNREPCKYYVNGQCNLKLRLCDRETLLKD